MKMSKISSILSIVAIWLAISQGTVIHISEDKISTPDVGSQNFADQIHIKALMKHLNKFQEIAYDNYGSRNALTGFNATEKYLIEHLQENTDLLISTQQWSYNQGYISNILPAKFVDISNSRTFAYPEFQPMPFSIGGDVIRTVTIDSYVKGGCTNDDYVNFLKGSIALIDKNSNTDCQSEVKAAFALANGAAAVILMASNGFPESVKITGAIPPILTFYVQAAPAEYLMDEIKTNGQISLYMNATRAGPIVVLQNIIAETPNGDENNTVVFGQHLDSVTAGPGINDDGSGSALGFEMALQLSNSNLDIQNKVRFIWFGGEEIGLVGSAHYVASLTPQEYSKIAAMIDTDMIGSPNYVWSMYDGNTARGTVKKGCTKITNLFSAFFNNTETPYEYVPFDGRSDYQPFINRGIPAGGLFTGAEKIKTAKEAQIYGGSVGVAFDDCYHQKCDTVSNINEKAYEVCAKATATILEQLAMMTDIREYLNE